TLQGVCVLFLITAVAVVIPAALRRPRGGYMTRNRVARRCNGTLLALTGLGNVLSLPGCRVLAFGFLGSDKLAGFRIAVCDSLVALCHCSHLLPVNEFGAR